MGKLASNFIGLYEIVKRASKVAYKLVLLVSMDHIHDIFHLSSLRKYIDDPSHVLKTKEIQLSEDLSYDKRPVQILDKRIK